MRNLDKSISKIIKTGVILLGVITLVVTEGWAQKFKWPEPAEKGAIAKEYYVELTSAVKSKKYAEGKAAINWLSKNAPNLNKSIYIHGSKIYEKLAIKAKGDKRKIYADSTLILYDKRMEVYKDQAKAMKRKAMSSYKLFKANPAKYNDIIKIFEKTLEVTPAKYMSKGIPIAYYDIVVKNQEKKKAYSQSQIIDKYNKAYVALGLLMKKPKVAPIVPDLKANLDKMFAKIATIDCKFIKDKWIPKFKANTSDIDMAKLVFNFGYKAECDFVEVVKAAELINKTEPTFEVTLYIAKKYKSRKNFHAAFPYYEKAVTMAPTKQQKSDLTKEVGDILSFDNKYAEAREKYLNALQLDPTNRGVYASIGNLYFSSFDRCAKKESMLEDRAVFILAHNLYYKAGNKAKMAQAKAEFPTSKDIFEQNKKVGDPIKIECWINKTVKIAKK